MGRRSEGPKLRWVNGLAYARFSYKGQSYELATGKRILREAEAEAAVLYADVISGRRSKGRIGAGSSTSEQQPLDELFAEWLAAISADRDELTVRTYERLARTRFLPYFRKLDRITTQSFADFARERLKHITRGSVIKEISALNVFLTWCVEEKRALASTEKPHPPKLPPRATGVRTSKMRREPVRLTADEAEAIIRAMPEWSEKRSPNTGQKFRLRAYFVFAWETGLRPETLSRLSVPEHWRPGQRSLRIDDASDKARFGRVVPLSPAAIAVLEECAPDEGPIFGQHKMSRWEAIKVAAVKVGIPRAEEVSPYDFRHGRGTQLVDMGASLTGVAHILGHKRVTTTNRYVRSSERAAEEALALLDGHQVAADSRGSSRGTRLAQARGSAKTAKNASNTWRK